MNEDINWDEIRSDDALLRPSALFDQTTQRNNHYVAGGFDPSEGMDAPLLRDEAYSEIPMPEGQSNLDLWHHCHWSPKVVNKAACPQLLAATIMCAIFMVGELVGGYLAGSLAIMCDAAHLLSDCAGFLLALSALFLSKRPPGPRMSYGYRRAEVLGALMSIMLIWLVTGIFVYLAILRLWEANYDIQVDAMMIVSGVGMCVNVLMALVLHGACHDIAHAHGHGHGHSHDPAPNGHIHYTDTSTTPSQTPAALVKKIGNSVYRPDTKNGYRNLAMDPLLNEGVMNTDRLANGTPGTLVGGTRNKAVHSSKTNLFRNGEYSSAKDGSHDVGSSTGLNQTGFEDVELLHPGSGRRHSTGEVSAEQSINVRAAAIHVLGDLIQSAGVFLASVIIKIYPEAKIVDPLCTFIFSIIVMCTTIKIVREATNVLMEGVPHQVRYESVLAALRGLSGVRAVHSLHIWSITNQQNVLTAHLAIDQYTDSDNTLRQALQIIRSKFRIDQATVQVERYNEETMAACAQCTANSDT